MKLKNMWKRFWTLDVHNHEGFTLVELIIVIAILAILSTGAIAGYSAYVESANKTADQAMFAEIKNVLTFAQYAGDLSGSAYIIVSDEGVIDWSDNAVAVMQDAYGDNWKGALKLNFGDWDVDPMISSGLAGGQNVLGSSFLADNTPGDLLNEVTGVIGTTVDFLTTKGYVGEELYSAMIANMNEDIMLDACDKMGISVKKDGAGNVTAFGDGVTNEQLANLMVFVASEEFTSGQGEPSTAANMLLMYTTYMGAANSAHGDDQMKADLQAALTGNSVTEIVSNLSNFGADYETVLDAYGTDEETSAKDEQAIVNMLSAVNKVSGQVSANDLKDANFFKSGTVTEYMNTYMAGAELAGILSDIPAGTVAIIITADGACVSSEYHAK